MTGSTGKVQCCGDHLAAARAGHTKCLQGLAEAGRFLPLGSPDRAAAGELRRLEVWQAAITTCRAGRRPTLSWLFASGWPSSIDAALTWQTRDLVDLHELMDRRDLAETDRVISEVCCSETPFLLEVDLYRHALRKATPEYLEVLLEAGCRSVWICRLAALEGKGAFLALAAFRGCPCDLIALKFAARSGNIPLLWAAMGATLLPNGPLFRTVGSLGVVESDHITHAAPSGDRLMATLIAALIWNEPFYCDMGSLGVVERDHIMHAARLAASEGHSACLGALLCWFGERVVGYGQAICIAERLDLNCLQTLQRAGCLRVELAAAGAAWGARLECLQYLMDLDPGLVDEPLLVSAVREGKPEAQIACLEFLQHRGCQWSAEGLEVTFSARTPEVLRYCLARVRDWHWDRAMFYAITGGSLECMQLLYNAGYEEHRSRKASCHPAVYLIEEGAKSVSRHTAGACLSLAVSLSGAPDAQLLDTAGAVRWGEDMLRYVRELGAPFSIRTTNTAAREGDVGALRYSLKNGAPWGASTFQAVMAVTCRPSQVNTEMCPDWLECLRCLHEHARAAGFPKRCRRPSKGAFSGRSWGESSGPTLAVLRYVCDHMGPAWAAPLLKSTAEKLAGWVVKGGGWQSGSCWHQHVRVGVEWQMVLYLGRKLKQRLPAPLSELVAMRRERAAALAGVFFKAGRLARGRGHPRFLALCGAMARLPTDLRERIAFQANLICCEAPGQFQAP
eukprot:jgi/Botrbrau1/8457/Bobra.0237s0074.1